MPSTTSLISRLKSDFPTVNFAKSDIFCWSPKEQAIYYANASDSSSLLHEVAHAALGHDSYRLDIDLIKMEREAWNYVAATLAPKYEVTISQDQVNTMLDTYRDWLHDRSLCPACEATGLQTEAKRYTCLACRGSWRVNEARSCALRRYAL